MVFLQVLFTLFTSALVFIVSGYVFAGYLATYINNIPFAAQTTATTAQQFSPLISMLTNPWGFATATFMAFIMAILNYYSFRFDEERMVLWGAMLFVSVVTCVIAGFTIAAVLPVGILLKK